MKRFVYPDLSVVCGEPRTECQTLTRLNPVLVVDVTSPSSIDYNPAMKRSYFESVESLEVYLVVDQNRLFVEPYARTGMDWQLQYFSDPEDVAPLETLGCSWSLRDIYRNIEFAN